MHRLVQQPGQRVQSPLSKEVRKELSIEEAAKLGKFQDSLKVQLLTGLPDTSLPKTIDKKNGKIAIVKSGQEKMFYLYHEGMETWLKFGTVDSLCKKIDYVAKQQKIQLTEEEEALFTRGLKVKIVDVSEGNLAILNPQEADVFISINDKGKRQYHVFHPEGSHRNPEGYWQVINKLDKAVVVLAEVRTRAAEASAKSEDDQVPMFKLEFKRVSEADYDDKYAKNTSFQVSAAFKKKPNDIVVIRCLGREDLYLQYNEKTQKLEKCEAQPASYLTLSSAVSSKNVLLRNIAQACGDRFFWNHLC